MARNGGEAIRASWAGATVDASKTTRVGATLATMALSGARMSRRIRRPDRAAWARTTSIGTALSGQPRHRGGDYFRPSRRSAADRRNARAPQCPTMRGSPRCRRSPPRPQRSRFPDKPSRPVGDDRPHRAVGHANADATRTARCRADGPPSHDYAPCCVFLNRSYDRAIPGPRPSTAPRGVLDQLRECLFRRLVDHEAAELEQTWAICGWTQQLVARATRLATSILTVYGPGAYRIVIVPHERRWRP